MKKYRKNKKIFFILVLTFLVNLYPHYNYDYPLHVDEWEFFINSRSILESESTIYRDLRMGDIRSNDLEIAMGTTIALMKCMGADWLVMFRILPSFISILTVLSVYIFARKKNYGTEAALFTALIPTTIRLLGPAFFVPVSLGLVFLPLSLFLVFYKKNYQIPLFIISMFLFYLHPPTAIALFIILLVHAVLNLKSDVRKTASLLSIFLLSLLLYLPYIIPSLSSEGFGTLTFGGGDISIPTIISFFGIIPTVFFITGTYLMSIEMKRDNFTLLASICIIFFTVVVFRIFGYTFFLMPTRSYMYLMLLMSMVAGYGLSKTRKMRIPYILLLVVILVSGTQAVLYQQYYHVIDGDDYKTFLWIDENTPKESRAVLNPWKARAFPAVAGREFYSYYHQGKIYAERNKEISAFMEDSCRDTDFMLARNISIVYNSNGCYNKDLLNPFKGTYILNV